MLMLRGILLGLFALPNFSCGKVNRVESESSQFYQLVEEDFKCEVRRDRRQRSRLKAMWSFKGGQEKDYEDVWDTLSRLPTEYRQWVFDHNFLKIQIKGAEGSTKGMTTLRGTSRLMRPIAMWISARRGNFFPLMHEVGHAVEDYVALTHESFDKDLTILYNWLQPSVEARHMRAYAKSNKTELFAEVFDSYYCSDESRKFMREKMPRTWFFAKRFLIDPAAPEKSSNSSHEGQLELVDADGDLVSDAFDKCPDTDRVDRPIFTYRSFYGCGPQQKGSEDADQDGVFDGDDLCPQTPKGANAWKKHTGKERAWLGCASGQSPQYVVE